MRIVELEDIEKTINDAEAIEAVRDGYVAFSNGLIEQPEPLQILFTEDDGTFYGDCHGKAAQGKGQPFFVIKVAASFYGNVEKGLPANNGMILVMSAETGQPIAILKDDGWLTQIRTAAAGTLAASLKPVDADAKLGVIGTGSQALLQARMITEKLGIKQVYALGRSSEKTAAFVERLKQAGINAVAADNAKYMCDNCAIVVTTTPASVPVLTSEDVTGPLHIVAVGADSPGKLEIDPKLTARASIIATDSHAQCLHHGDFGAAVRDGLLAEDFDISFPDVLAGKCPEADFASAEISIVDMTGLGVQDLYISKLTVEKLGL